jgi:hypothetical protein
MPSYSVHFFCNECSGVHPLGIGIEGDFGFDDKASIADVYAGKELPAHVAQLRNNYTNCPVTGKLTQQKDNNQVFLVRVR